MERSEYLAQADKHFDSDVFMLGTLCKSPGYHTRVPDGTRVHPIVHNLDYAIALLRDGSTEHVQRAAGVIRKILLMQDTEPTSPTYGIWPWYLEESLEQMAPPDFNWADFCGARLAVVLQHFAEHLDNVLTADIRAALGHAAWSIFRRNVRPGYTNIAIMGAGVTLAAGEMLGEERLVDYGRRRLRRFIEYTDDHGGFNEYNSPTYTMVALHAVERILDLVRDGQARRDAEALRQAIWHSIAEHFHPATGQWAGPHSRAYSDRLQSHVVEDLTARVGVALVGTDQGRSADALHGTGRDRGLPCPAELIDRFCRLPAPMTAVRRRFIRRQSEETSTWGTTWLCEQACLGSVNVEDFWTQRRPVLGYWAMPQGPAAVLRVRFIKDGRDFASAGLRTAQHGPRVLMAVGMAAGRGDFHCSLDRSADGHYQAHDLRLRIQLDAEGAEVSILGESTYALAAGHWRAVVHTLPGRFLDHAVRWETGRDGRTVFVDGILHRGSLLRFAPAEIGPVLIPAALELIRADQPPLPPPFLGGSEGPMAQMQWPVVEGVNDQTDTIALTFPTASPLVS